MASGISTSQSPSEPIDQWVALSNKIRGQPIDLQFSLYRNRDDVPYRDPNNNHHRHSSCGGYDYNAESCLLWNSCDPHNNPIEALPALLSEQLDSAQGELLLA